MGHFAWLKALRRLGQSLTHENRILRLFALRGLRQLCFALRSLTQSIFLMGKAKALRNMFLIDFFYEI